MAERAYYQLVQKLEIGAKLIANNIDDPCTPEQVPNIGDIVMTAYWSSDKKKEWRVVDRECMVNFSEGADLYTLFVEPHKHIIITQ